MAKYIFLREYTDETAEKYISILSNHISQLPYTLSYPIYQAEEKIKSEQYGAAMNYVLDFFEISVQYSSILLFAILKKEALTEAGAKILTAIINKIDTKRPLSFGDWVNDMFMPLMQAASSCLPEHPFVKSMNAHVCSKRKNILLGGKKDASIVQIRNEYKGHSTTLSEAIYKGVIYTLEERVMEMLKGLSSLSEYEFYTVDKERTLWSVKGITPAISPNEDITDLKPAHYYMVQKGTAGTTEVIDMYPLIFMNDKNHIYIFQSLKDENVSYISSNENAQTYISDTLNDHIDLYFQEVVPSFDISKELNWDELKNCMYKESMSFMEQIYKEKKYNQELFVDREQLTATLHDFWQSDKTLFPLLGEAGQGKTNQLCFWTEGLLDKKEAVLIFNGTDFSDITLDNKLRSIFGYNARRDITRMVNSIHEKAVQNGACVYFFFDAINECLIYKGSNTDTEGALCLYNAIRDILISDKYPNFKVLFTCRFYTWKNLLQGNSVADSKYIYNAGNEDELAVRSFSKSETRKAYEIYQRLYQMTTRYEEIDKKTLVRLKDPLILKFVSSNYLGKPLSENSSDYTSLSLFEKMMNDISVSYAGKLQCEIITSIADYMLSEYLNGNPVDSISTSDIKNAYNRQGAELHELSKKIYKKDGITVAYAELLNKAERPVLRESDKYVGDEHISEIMFIYERFLEFVMARSFVKQESAKNTVYTRPIPAAVYLSALEKAVLNVVFIGTIRNALVMDCLRTGDYTTILELAALHSDNYVVMQLLTEVMNMLIRENYENELFTLVDKMLSEKVPDGDKLTAELNTVNKKIESNQADEDTISRYKVLSAELAPVIRLRNLASVTTINGIMLTDYFNENLYKKDALEFLWRLMMDDIHDVRSDACMYTYYLSNKTHTLDYTPLTGNLCVRVIRDMYAIIKSRPLLINMCRKYTRQRAFIFLETATRLATLQIIDELMIYHRNDDTVTSMLKEIDKITRYFTVNFYLIRAFMPILQFIMRKQITFQSTYVNNAVEYQGFWSNEEFSAPSKDGNWTRESLTEAMSFVWHHSRYHDKKNSAECLKEEERFRNFHPYVISAYRTGDSFTYFTLERLLIIMGACRWQNIKPCIDAFFTDESRKTRWFDYSQMSILYVLFQVSIYSEEEIDELIEIYTRESEIWTRKCKGLYKAPNSHKANPTGYYKRNVMTWYSVVYCGKNGDGAIRENDKRCVPLFYDLIDAAIQNRDKELLVHLIENISELVTDFGYINTAMGLLKYILVQYDTVEKVNAIDEIKVDRAGLYQYDLVRIISNVLSTAKNYYQSEVDSFIKKDLKGLSFPGIPTYREEILTYNPSGETLSDLFTHKFGKFLTWGLLFEESIDNFAHEAMCTAVNSQDCFAWYNKVVRILLKHMFKLKL